MSSRPPHVPTSTFGPHAPPALLVSVYPMSLKSLFVHAFPRVFLFRNPLSPQFPPLETLIVLPWFFFLQIGRLDCRSSAPYLLPMRVTSLPSLPTRNCFAHGFLRRCSCLGFFCFVSILSPRLDVSLFILFCEVC